MRGLLAAPVISHFSAVQTYPYAKVACFGMAHSTPLGCKCAHAPHTQSYCSHIHYVYPRPLEPYLLLLVMDLRGWEMSLRRTKRKMHLPHLPSPTSPPATNLTIVLLQAHVHSSLSLFFFFFFSGLSHSFVTIVLIVLGFSPTKLLSHYRNPISAFKSFQRILSEIKALY